MTFDELVKQIKKWDSNTFFASGCNLTDDESIKLAERFISWSFNKLDGVKLDVWLSEIRED
jgi:hypothetical protein